MGTTLAGQVVVCGCCRSGHDWCGGHGGVGYRCGCGVDGGDVAATADATGVRTGGHFEGAGYLSELHDVGWVRVTNSRRAQRCVSRIDNLVVVQVRDVHLSSLRDPRHGDLFEAPDSDDVNALLLFAGGDQGEDHVGGQVGQREPVPVGAFAGSHFEVEFTQRILRSGDRGPGQFPIASVDIGFLVESQPPAGHFCSSRINQQLNGTAIDCALVVPGRRGPLDPGASRR